MTRTHLLPAAAAAALMSVSAAFAQQPLQHSPITSGFWSWPREKTVTPQAISDACQEHVAIQFSDGRYLGLKLRDADKKPLASPVVNEVGFCQFDPAKQIERCELRITDEDGKVTTGTMESNFASDADSSIKMTVTPKIFNGQPSKAAPFEVFPIRCPDAMVWTSLNGGQAQK